MLKAIDLAKRLINVFQFPETVAAARVVVWEGYKARSKDSGYWDREIAQAQAEARRVGAEEALVNWFRQHPAAAERVLAKPMGERTVRF